MYKADLRPIGKSRQPSMPAYLSLRLRRNLLYDPLVVFSSKASHRLNQLDQILVAKKHRPPATATNGYSASTVVQHAGMELNLPSASWN
jgi:hypothetical protein